MKIKLNKEQKIGLFAIIIAVSLYFTINYLKGKDIFGSTNTYYTVFDNVEGLSVTSPIYIKGYKVGTILEIEYLEPQEKFLVTMKVDAKYHIPQNSAAQLYSSSILGGKSIRINIVNGGKIIGERDTLRSEIEPGIIDNIAAQIIPLKDQATELIANLNKTFLSVNEVLNDQAKEQLSASISNLDRTLKSIKAIASNIEDRNPEISSIITNLDTLSFSLNKSAAALDNGLADITEVTASLKKADIEGTITSLKNVLIELNNPNGSVGKLIKTDSLHTSIDSLIRDIDVLVKNIQKDPKKYIKISVF
ncbi:MAG: MCE family protein [Bacteroidales bacterium]|jgi:phospholipid/cholesterol/gamma-HCH transport system substrate-binding protein|nr:MCE family protein [Bacteroidales bacterium]